MLTRLGVCVAAALAATAVLSASAPTFWTVSTQADFLKGDVDNLSIDSDGRIFLGPATTQIAETSAPFLWTILAGPDGTLWAGTGNEGQVLKIGRDGKTSNFFDATEMEVHALALAPGGGLYVGTSPDGRIYHVSADGTSKPFYDPDDKYIWAMVTAPDGSVYAATGEKGNIYKIAPDGKGSLFYKTNTTNVVTLALDKSGNLLAGTESPGRIFRISRDGKAFVLLDSPFKEIHAIRIADDGTIYAAAFSGTPGGEDRSAPSINAPSAPEPRAPVPSVSAEITAITVVDASSSPSGGATSSNGRSRNPKGAIYRIRPDGLWDTLWEAADDWPFDLLIENGGSLLVGTGKEGKMFRLSGDPARATLVARAAARQVTALIRDGSGRIVAATSNPGKVFTLASTRASLGTYDSDIRDAGTVATWGAIRWRAAAKPGEVEVFTRTGNTATPDETWSPWSKAYTAEAGEKITSPNARYLQWRSVLKATAGAQGPILTSVTTAYLPRNLRPVVSSITVHPPGIVFQKPFSTGDPELAGFDDQSTPERKLAAAAAAQPGSSSPLGRRTYQKGLQTLVWKAEDENDDDLVYDVLFRREGETAWKTLRKATSDAILVWDTTTIPNGTYFVKIVASDAPSNPSGTALAGELDSSAFEVDNSAPTIAVSSVRVDRARTIITFDVRDDHSPIQRVEFSQDGQRWRGVFPVDGIADSRDEHYDLAVDGELGDRGLTLRASDSMNNISTAHVDPPPRQR